MINSALVPMKGKASIPYNYQLQYPHSYTNDHASLKLCYHNSPIAADVGRLTLS